ncbi:DUF4870 family protein [Pseudorhodoplanes sp.]|jgi:uncharacterized membrane protein|uniref:DUF4870 family protein n=1 Tax=Pseudorhodoplanes sp. TaxID=1934341 RepID=UPI002CE819C8|nr:DUF4870 domain-containing protein [Pseudorhodoplanes sp.]HWV43321.1 DUF4870 domain-containing protein [Pseudorhodoplanes sp.]
MSYQQPIRQPGEPVPSSEERNWAIAVWLLYLGGHITFITVIAGLVIAYMKRAQFAGTPYESHMTSAIRTFWIALIGGIVSAVLIFVLVGIPLLIALVIWTIFRCVRGLVRAINGEPIADPNGWL